MLVNSLRMTIGRVSTAICGILLTAACSADSGAAQSPATANPPITAGSAASSAPETTTAPPSTPAPAPPPSATITYTIVSREGYRAVVTLRVAQPIRLSQLAPEARTSVESCGNGNYINRDINQQIDAVIPGSFTAQDRTSGGFTFDSLIQITGPTAAPDRSQGAAGHCVDSYVKAGQSGQIYFIIPDYYGPAHPAGDPKKGSVLIGVGSLAGSQGSRCKVTGRVVLEQTEFTGCRGRLRT